MDTTAIVDPEALMECVREGFEEVLALGGPHEAARLPLREITEAPGARAPRKARTTASAG
jgi:hypothetical protein